MSKYITFTRMKWVNGKFHIVSPILNLLVSTNLAYIFEARLNTYWPLQKCVVKKDVIKILRFKSPTSSAYQSSRHFNICNKSNNHL